MIHRSKSGKLAWSDKFLADQQKPQRNDPQEFDRVIKGVAIIFILIVTVFVALGFHRHFIGG